MPRRRLFAGPGPFSTSRAALATIFRLQGFVLRRRTSPTNRRTDCVMTFPAFQPASVGRRYVRASHGTRPVVPWPGGGRGFILPASRWGNPPRSIPPHFTKRARGEVFPTLLVTHSVFFYARWGRVLRPVAHCEPALPSGMRRPPPLTSRNRFQRIYVDSGALLPLRHPLVHISAQF